MLVTSDDTDDLFAKVDDLGDKESAPARLVTESINQPVQMQPFSPLQRQPFNPS